MSPILSIVGGQSAAGTVRVSGAKNAALPILAAALFARRATLHNVPRIGDVLMLLRIFESYGVSVSFEGNTVELDTSDMRPESSDPGLVRKIRASILLIPALLRRFGKIELPYPGGCNLGKRPIDEHVKGLEALGYSFSETDGLLSFSGEGISSDAELSTFFSVTATENLLMAAATRPATTRIRLAAVEPHVMDTANFLRLFGARIEASYDHTFEVHGSDEIPEHVEYSIIGDYLESGFFVLLGALCARDHIDILDARTGDLASFLVKATEAGIRYEILPGDVIRVYYSRENLRAVTLQTNIFPGFPTDIQSPFSVLLTQADGISRVHEVLFEGRLNMLMELENMKGHSAVLNPHEALIFGPTRLRGTTVTSWDLRSGASMILAGLIADGETRVTNVEYIERGYENILGKLADLGIRIDRIET
jgi:UDP-N-acetylglucosamine 1-carboxyvinyltransferase